MNIFFPHCSGLLTDHRPHGDGLVAYGFLSHLAKRGHNLYVAAEELDLRAPLAKNIHVTLLGGTQRHGLGFRWRYLRECRALYKRLEKEVAFDVVHQLNPVYTGVSLALFDSKQPLVLGPYVASWPDDPDAVVGGRKVIGGLARSARSWLAGVQQWQASATLLTTPAAAMRLTNPSSSAASSILLPHGLDTTYFSPSADAMESNNQDILFLSNLVERKGVLDLIAAYGNIAAAFPLSRLLIAGDGLQRVEAEALAERTVAGNRIVFLGRQTREQSLALLQQCAIFCQPSHGEPYGMSVAEAMGCAKPLVATQEGGLGYLVDSEGGIKVPMKSPLELGAALAELLSDPERRQRMGEYNRSRAVSTMSWERVIDQLETVYHTLVDVQKAPAPAGAIKAM